MKHPLRQIRTLVRARRRLRDVAAGDFAVAEAETRRAAQLRDEESARRRQLIEEAPGRILAGTGSNVLVLLELERQAAERLEVQAEQRRQEAAVVSEGRRAALGRREAELRTAERLLEKVVDELEAAAHRAEQSAIDDLVASRGRRREGEP